MTKPNAAIRLFLDELYRWNKKINLTSVRREGAEEVLIKPSLAMAEYLKKTEKADVFDIGSGGGIPAIVLALCLPAHSFRLIESNLKKSVFLSHVAAELKLENVEVINNHTERLIADGKFRHTADFVTARAVNRRQVFDAAHYLLKPGGRVLIHRSSEKRGAAGGFRLLEENEHMESYGPA